MIAATVVYLNAGYYGWRFALWISWMLYVRMGSRRGPSILPFLAVGIIPKARPQSLRQMMSFGIWTHTFWLNIALGIVGAGLFVAAWRFMRQPRQEQERENRS